MNDTKKKIIESSITLIAQYGYTNYTLGTLTKYMDISKGVVNYHFPQKDMVFDTIMHEYEEKVLSYSLKDYLFFVYHNKDFYITVKEIKQNHRDEKGVLVYKDIKTNDFKELCIQAVINAVSDKIANEDIDDIEFLTEKTMDMIKIIKGEQENESNNSRNI